MGVGGRRITRIDVDEGQCAGDDEADARCGRMTTAWRRVLQ